MRRHRRGRRNIIISALSLLAFLFFLNILQHGIREIALKPSSSMTSDAPYTEPYSVEEFETTNRYRRNVEFPDAEKSNLDSSENDEVVSRKSRRLLQVFNDESKNQERFKRDLEEADDAFPVSDLEFDDQNLETDNENNNNKVFSKRSADSEVPADENEEDDLENIDEVEDEPSQTLTRVKKDEGSSAEQQAEDIDEQQSIPIKRAINENSEESENNAVPLQGKDLKQNTSTTESYDSTAPRIRRDYQDAVGAIHYGNVYNPDPLDSPFDGSVPYYVDPYSSFNQSYLLDSPSPTVDTYYYDLMKPRVPGYPLRPPYSKPSFWDRHFNPPQSDRMKWHLNMPFDNIAGDTPSIFYSRQNYHFFKPILSALRRSPKYEVIRLVEKVLKDFSRPLWRVMHKFGRNKFGRNKHGIGKCFDLVVCETQRAAKMVGRRTERFITSLK